MSMDPLVSDLFERPNSRMPGLAFPFAVVGAAAGWLSAGFLANPFMAAAREGLQVPCTLCAAAMCAVIGAALTRWCNPKSPFHRAYVGRLRLVIAVLAAGSATGAITASVMIGYRGAVREGLFLGFFCAVPFIPICILVLDAARRAERARLGSIVAAADRREVWSILIAALAVTTLAAVPDWPAWASGEGLAPLMATTMALSSALFMAALFCADARAIQQVTRATEGVEASPGGDEVLASTSVPKVDLGLGDDILAKLTRHAAAYRSRDRAVALVLGSPDQARAALRRAIRRNVVGLALCFIALASHGVAAAYYSVIRESTASGGSVSELLSK